MKPYVHSLLAEEEGPPAPSSERESYVRELVLHTKRRSRSDPSLRAVGSAHDADVHDADVFNASAPVTSVRRCLPEVPTDSAQPVRHFGSLSTRSTAMGDIFDTLSRFARSETTVTLMGSTGVGKDVLAHAIHEVSSRSDKPLVVFDCGSVAPNLAESELLGHERGAFTGAVSAHAGAFERAHGGTLFLDEIGELPLDLQSRLLRALESRRVRRVGGGVDRSVDVRVIVATNRDLRADVAAGRFREDLLFRLAVVVVSVPPLRERLDDLPELVGTLLADMDRADLCVSDAALEALRSHPWPGNIRELKNALTSAVAFVEPGARVLDPRHLRLLWAADIETAWIDSAHLAGKTLKQLERRAIEETMIQTNGDKVVAAKTLGISLSTLYEKLRRHGLSVRSA
jgi:DNA-binding NtrC family response regulator